MLFVLSLWHEQGVQPSMVPGQPASRRAPFGSQALAAIAVSPKGSIKVGISPT